MNHLRRLLEAIDAREVAQSPILPQGGIGDQLLSETKDAASRCQCFWLGDVDAVCDLQVVSEIARVPFLTVWFEGESQKLLGPGTLIGMVAHQCEDGLVNLVGFARVENQWVLLLVVNDLNMATGSFSVGVDDSVGGECANYYVYALRAFCCAMNCSNVVREQHYPDKQLQRAREKRGKAPLFSYWTLKLNGRAQGGDCRGGTHASPRVHLRRGHPRQYQKGKWTWVQPHAVGSPSAGMVHKDYAAGPRLIASPTLAPPPPPAA